jgi:hypothetical protein
MDWMMAPYGEQRAMIFFMAIVLWTLSSCALVLAICRSARDAVSLHELASCE